MLRPSRFSAAYHEWSRRQCLFVFEYGAWWRKQTFFEGVTSAGLAATSTGCCGASIAVASMVGQGNRTRRDMDGCCGGGEAGGQWDEEA